VTTAPAIKGSDPVLIPRPNDGRLRSIGSVTLLLTLCALLFLPAVATDAADDDPMVVRIKTRPHGSRLVELRPAEAGDYKYVITWNDGRVETYSPDAFSTLLYRDYESHDLLFRLFNITKPIGIAWVGLGLLGQVLFTGRMLVQWLASEKNRRSVVPTAFWWMSLAGGAMLFSYFVWRKDIVGVLGQSTGVFIYARNLILIYRPRPAPVSVEDDPAPEPALDDCSA